MTFVLREVADLSGRNAIFKLRADVWNAQRPGQLGLNSLHDEVDLRAHHWAIYLENTVVAAARLSIHMLEKQVVDFYLYKQFEVKLVVPVASMNRCVVHPAYRKKGLADLLDHARMQYATDMKCKTLVGIALTENRASALKEKGFDMVGKTIDNTNGFFSGLPAFLFIRSLTVCDNIPSEKLLSKR